MDVSFAIWTATLAGFAGLLILDLVIVGRRPHDVSMREASLWTAFYVGLAVVFGLVVLLAAPDGGRYAGEFYAGWLTEYSLSVDNLFVFVIIMARFAVPRHLQQMVLMVGIVLALVLRGIFIAAGSAAISSFSWMFYLFGAFLVVTAVKLIRTSGNHDDEEFRENAALRLVQRILPTTPEFDGARLVTRLGGRRVVTPLLVVMIAIGSTDLLFALDSIPAVFGLTTEPYLVFAANAFALMGLRQLYFLLGGLLERLVHLGVGLAVILAFIGVKLVLEALHTNELPFLNGGEPVAWAPAVPTWLSLAVIVLTLAVTTATSIAASRRPSSTRDAAQR